MRLVFGAMVCLAAAAWPAGGAVLDGLERLVGFRPGCAEAPLPNARPHDDFRIPGTGLILRQVLDREHPRIATQWWGVFHDNRLLECWFFSPYGNDEGKLLAGYEIEQIAAAPEGRVVFRTHGGMHRPGGYGWMQAYDFVFLRTGEGLRLDYVLDRFFFNYKDQRIDLKSERRLGNEPRIEIRVRDDIAPALLKKCGFQHPLEAEMEARQYFPLLARAAACLERLPGAKTCHRQLDEPSFIERGGQPADCR